MEQQDFVFRATDGTALAGWMMTPETPGPHPLVIMTHGLSALIDLGLAAYAERFVAAGFMCLAYDHRNWGRSGGWPRCESDPWQQIADMRDAISYARTLPQVQGDRIGIWGTSFSGGHVLAVAALDRRVRCVVSQVPFISGSRNFDIWVPEEVRADTLVYLDADRDARAQGAMPLTQPVATPGSEVADWVHRIDTEGLYRDELTLRTLDVLRTYEPGLLTDRIAPTPLMMIVAEGDTTNPVDWQVEAFECAGGPKQLVRIPGGHYDVYIDRLEEAASAATGWFTEHLRG